MKSHFDKELAISLNSQQKKRVSKTKNQQIRYYIKGEKILVIV
jgi:hypothetical protein